MVTAARKLRVASVQMEHQDGNQQPTSRSSNALWQSFEHSAIRSGDSYTVFDLPEGFRAAILIRACSRRRREDDGSGPAVPSSTDRSPFGRDTSGIRAS
jgi:hypothetical protein